MRYYPDDGGSRKCKLWYLSSLLSDIVCMSNTGYIDKPYVYFKKSITKNQYEFVFVLIGYIVVLLNRHLEDNVLRDLIVLNRVFVHTSYDYARYDMEDQSNASVYGGMICNYI